jgi:hypothetical protein
MILFHSFELRQETKHKTIHCNSIATRSIKCKTNITVYTIYTTVFQSDTSTGKPSALRTIYTKINRDNNTRQNNEVIIFITTASIQTTNYLYVIVNDNSPHVHTLNFTTPTCKSER